ncbi:MAG: YkuS family protein [Thermicanus sp.]|nr:YkuS family protein [Thermicanus sp.]
MAKVAVSNTLTNVSRLLREQGFEVLPFTRGELNGRYDAVVLSGENENMMGMSERMANIPVVNADGMTAEQVVEALKNRLQR